MISNSHLEQANPNITFLCIFIIISHINDYFFKLKMNYLKFKEYKIILMGVSTFLENLYNYTQ